MFTSLPYITGNLPTHPEPLSRYLPPLLENVTTTWLQSHLAGGSWVLDPFGASPLAPIEAARSGYRILICANNPIARFLIELAANPPSEEDLSGALAQLAASRKGNERLEPHIQNLYSTYCEQCGREIIAKEFLWERGANAPFGRIYECLYCGDGGERSATPADEAKAMKFSSGGLHWARALERVAAPGDPDRAHAEEALATYLPRSVYVIFTLVNKLEGFPREISTGAVQGSGIQRNLAALLLIAFDKANTLWHYPIARERPKQLTVPPRFREKNIWMALEEAVEQLIRSKPGVPLTIWPEQPPETGGVAIFEGRLRGLKEELSLGPEIPISAILAPFPRPNQAFWTLSALWAGWLWGRDAVGPFKGVLRRRRYDWAWHTTALHAALSNLDELVSKNTPFFGLIGEVEPSFLSSVLIAAEIAGLKLLGQALRAESGQAQILWQVNTDKRRVAERDQTGETSGLASAAAKDYLAERAEPADYIHIHAASLSTIIDQGDVSSEAMLPSESYARMHEAFEEAFTYRRGFIRFGGSDKSLEVGQWWLQADREISRRSQPLADRVERLIVEQLIENSLTHRSELDATVCAHMTGLYTPEIELLLACLNSYGEERPPGSGNWQLRAQDTPKARQEDIVAIRRSLIHIGEQIGFKVVGESPVLWKEQPDKVAYAFFLTASAMFARFLYSEPYPPARSLIVFPGGRANLVAYKLRHDARIKNAIDRGWRMIKFRLIRRLAETHLLNRENIDEQLALDPLMEDAAQMRLL
ncbi:MAG: hypothetical protein P8Y03_08985 [Anaerolineales bacterium]|jgi:hypothetical protein